MGKLKPDLFQLIKSLDGNEKGYFKKYSLIHSSEAGSVNNYLRLFDAIDAMQEYDEQEIKRLFKGEKFLEQLSVTKNYLYNSVLKSLRSYSSKATVHLQLLSALEDIQLLIGKGLYERALECISAARKKAVENEFFGYETELIELERTLFMIQPKGNYLEVISNLNKDRSLAVDKLRTEQEFMELTYRANAELFFPDTKRKEVTAGKFIGELKTKIFSSPVSTPSVYAGHLFSNLRMMYYRIKGSHADSYPEAVKGFDLLRQNPFIIQKNPYAFYNKAFHMGIIMERLGLERELNTLLREIPEFEKHCHLKLNPKLRGFILQEHANLSIIHYLNSGQFEKGLTFIRATEKEIKKSESQFARSSIYTFYYYAVVFFISTGNFKDAVSFLNRILVIESYSILPFIAMLSKYFLVIAHYELGNRELLPSLDKLFDPGESIEPLEYLKSRLPLILNKKEEKAVFAKFRQRLLESTNKTTLQGYFDFLAWAEKKIQSKR